MRFKNRYFTCEVRFFDNNVDESINGYSCRLSMLSLPSLALNFHLFTVFVAGYIVSMFVLLFVYLIVA